MLYVLPIVLIVTSNVFYNISAKSTPSNVNSFASLTITYLVAAAVSAFLLVCTTVGKDGVLVQFKNINWTSYVLGLSLVGLEFGYLQAYRAGWNISEGSLVANICLAAVLVVVGVLLYKEKLTFYQLMGMVLCVVGLLFINKR